jgi:serine/threonine protein kinase/tetratricopeptide (TPR) repeat protein
MSCPAPDRVLGYVAHWLTLDEREGLEDHIDSCDACRELLVALARSGIADLGGAGSDHPEQIGRYRIVDRRGQGGMGTVYEAHDPQLDRRVALKLIHPDLVARRGVEWFVGEGRALARLAHPNIVAVYDAGVDGDHVYIAMELVTGDTLAGWLASAQRSWREIVPKVVGLARGLAAAHRAGIVHLDVKPNNVLIADDGVAKLVDFGLAQHMESSDEVTPAASYDRLARTRTAVGTPGFMAPEQQRGEEVGPPADQYGLCVMLHGALDGKPSPRWLLRTIERGRAHQPTQRFASMDALATALDPRRRDRRRRRLAGAVAASIAISASVIAVAHSSDRDATDRMCMVAASERADLWTPVQRATVQVALLATGVPYAGETWSRVDTAVTEYLRQLASAEATLCERHPHDESARATIELGFACLADRRRELAEASDRLRSLSATDVRYAVSIVHALGGADECANVSVLEAERVAVSTPEGARARDEVTRMIAAAHSANAAGRYREAVDQAHRAVARARPLGGVTLASALLVLGENAPLVEGLPASEAALREAEVVSEGVHADDLRARALTRLINVIAREPGREKEALALESIVEAAVTRASNRGRLEPAVRQAIGVANMYLGHSDLAIAALRTAVAGARAALAPDDPRMPDYLASLGSALAWGGHLAEATQIDEEMVRIARNVYGPNHPETARFEVKLALKRAAAGECELAVRELAQSRDRLGDLPPDSPVQLAIAGAMGQCYLRLDRLDDALREQRARQKALLEAKRDHTAEMAACVIDIGIVEHSMGHPDAAIVEYQRAIDDLEVAVGKTDARLALPLGGIGEAALALHQPERALAPLERALALETAAGGSKASIGTTQFLLASTLGALHRDPARARQLAETARSAFEAAGGLYKSNLDAVNAWLKEQK